MPMLCKLLGLGLMTACGYLAGDALTLTLKKQEALLREYQFFLALLAQMVAKGLSSRDIWHKLLERSASFPEMQLLSCPSLRQYRLPKRLSSEIRRELDSVFGETGRLSKDALLESIKSKKRFSEEILQNIVKKRCKAEKLYRKVSVLSALAVAILLL